MNKAVLYQEVYYKYSLYILIIHNINFWPRKEYDLLIKINLRQYSLFSKVNFTFSLKILVYFKTKSANSGNIKCAFKNKSKKITDSL